MSDRDLAMQLVSSIPDAQLHYVVGLLQNFKAAIDEAGRGTLQFQEEEP